MCITVHAAYSSQCCSFSGLYVCWAYSWTVQKRLNRFGERLVGPESRVLEGMGMGCTCSSAETIFLLGGWVDSIRQVDVDLNFLLVLYSTVGLYRLVCLFVDWIYVGKIFRVGRIHWLPTQCCSWVGNCPPCPLGSRAYMHMASSIQLLYLRVAVMETYVKFLFDLSL